MLAGSSTMPARGDAPPPHPFTPQAGHANFAVESMPLLVCVLACVGQQLTFLLLQCSDGSAHTRNRKMLAHFPKTAFSIHMFKHAGYHAAAAFWSSFWDLSGHEPTPAVKPIGVVHITCQDGIANSAFLPFFCSCLSLQNSCSRYTRCTPHNPANGCLEFPNVINSLDKDLALCI